MYSMGEVLPTRYLETAIFNQPKVPACAPRRGPLVDTDRGRLLPTCTFFPAFQFGSLGGERAHSVLFGRLSGNMADGV